MKLEKLPITEIESESEVKLIEAGDVTEITYMRYKNDESFIRKINSDIYVDIRTGEVKEYAHSDNRGCDIQGLKRTFNKARYVINANCTKEDTVLMVTLTYRQRDSATDECIPMTDHRKLYHDLDLFNKKMRRKFEKSYPDFRFIICCEPQCTGSWHAHILYIFNEKDAFLPIDEIYKMWGNGYVKIERIGTEIDNVANYLIAYLTNLSFDEIEEEFPTVDLAKMTKADVGKRDEISGKEVKKKYIKNARLYFYPPYFHPIRWSKNCRKPSKEYLSYGEAMQRHGDDILTYESCNAIVDENGKTVNVIQKKYLKKEVT